jgi:hypothetical protein
MFQGQLIGKTIACPKCAKSFQIGDNRIPPGGASVGSARPLPNLKDLVGDPLEKIGQILEDSLADNNVNIAQVLTANIRSLGTLRSLLNLALFNDCLRIIEQAVMADGKVDPAEIDFVFPLIRACAKQYPKVRKDYQPFADLKRDEAVKFVNFHRQDAAPFGDACRETSWLGLTICHRLAALTNEVTALKLYETMAVGLTSAVISIGGVTGKETAHLEELKKRIGARRIAVEESNARRPTAATPTPSPAARPKVFVSHSSQDRDFVEREVVKFLNEQQIDTWYSRTSIESGEDFNRRIREGLQQCNWFLVVMSPRSAQSQWVMAEVNWASSNRRQNIIPVMMDSCNLDDFGILMGLFNYVDLRPAADQAEGRRNVLRRLMPQGGGIVSKDALDLVEERQRHPEPLRKVCDQVIGLLDRYQLRRRELRPSDSFSIRGDDERRLVQQLSATLQTFPAPQRTQFPALYHSIAKLRVLAGDFGDALQGFRQVADVLRDPLLKGEAHYNAYRAGLEQRAWGEAQRDLEQAIRLNTPRFAPYPTDTYRLERILGAGGFGVAFLCLHQFLAEKVVIKSLTLDGMDRNVDMVFQEARLLTKLNHPGIVEVKDCNYADAANRSRPYLVMEYFDGLTLEQYVETHGPLVPYEVTRLVQEVAAALEEAHSQGITHRDIKPANIMVRRDEDVWEAKLIDFGLAFSQDMLQTAALTQGRSTLGYSIAGTIEYAAPEQLGRLPGVPVGPQADYHSLGKTCCFALFKTTHLTEKHWKSIRSKAFKKWLEALMSDDPNKRWPKFPKVPAISRPRKKKVMAAQGVASDSDEGEDDPSGDETDKLSPTAAEALAAKKQAPRVVGVQRVAAPASLVVLRGMKPNAVYPLHDGANYIGRAVQEGVDIDLTAQDHPDHVSISRLHAIVTLQSGKLFVQDLDSTNGSYLNRQRLKPGTKHPLAEDDVLQLGRVQFKIRC